MVFCRKPNHSTHYISFKNPISYKLFLPTTGTPTFFNLDKGEKSLILVFSKFSCTNWVSFPITCS